MTLGSATPPGDVLARHQAGAVSTTLNIGLVAVVLAVALSFASGSTAMSTQAPTWVLPIAIIALAVGVPHGALDHLTLRRALTLRQFAVLALGYTFIAGLGAAAIIVAPVPAFLVVVAFTVWHFGTGDVEATSSLQGKDPERGFSRIVLALALGSAPVLLPLTSPAAAATLALIEPRLGELLTPALIVVARTAVFIVIAIALVILVKRRQLRGALELVALTALGCLASPLLAFAVYFGLWHALRHTARLAQYTYGYVSAKTIALTFQRGVPALIGFIIVVGILAARSSSFALTGSWLWFGLAIVWGLTIPHMVFVAAFDRRGRLTSTH
jgi:Brp/Blh family beta-carotene 15,15'-monooxygenase